MAAVMQVRSMAATAMNTVFTSQRMAPGTVGPTRAPISNRGAERRSNSLAKLSMVHWDGSHAGVVA